MSMEIDGSTQLAGVMGWPLAHTLSPAMHNAAYQALGLPWVYLPLPVHESAQLPRVVSGMRALPFVGFNVTMPYKRILLDMCDEVAALARLAGAVNTVHVHDGVLIGYNTDGRGLLASLEEETGFVPQGRRVAMIGSGGAAGAVLAALVLAGAAHVTVISRDPAHAEDLVDRIGIHARDTELVAVAAGPGNGSFVEAADVVVNATPLGMGPDDALPVDPLWLHRGQIVSDMVYRPATTKLLRAAAEVGATPVGGLGMLVAQGAMSLELWNANATVSAPRDVMRAAAEAAMADQERAAAGTVGV
jgi:shikimate dehydrogenase